MPGHVCVAIFTEATVVTQRDNRSACRLYERNGYSIGRVEQYYHFWPLAPAVT